MMLLRLLMRSFAVRRGRVLLAVAVVAVGAALASSLLSVLMDVDDKLGKELRTYGANIVLVPRDDGALPVEVAGHNLGSVGQSGYIPESELYKIKKIFWKNNITGFAPFLKGTVEVRPAAPGTASEATGLGGVPQAAGPGGAPQLADPGGAPVKLTLVGTWFDRELAVPGETPGKFKTGIAQISPWWKVEGAWASADGKSVMVGSTAARRLGVKPGDRISVRIPAGGVSSGDASSGESKDFTVAGVLTAGGFEDDQILAALPVAQALFGVPGKVSEVKVSALVVPEEKLAGKDPEKMTPREKEILYCTPTVASIGEQIREVLPPAKPKAIRQIAQAEGLFMSKVQLMILLVTVLTLAASGLGLMAAMTTSVLERRKEIGIIKSVGADGFQIVLLFLAEAAITGVIGGLAGYAVGIGLARAIGLAVFDSQIAQRAVVLPATVGLSVGLALLGSLIPVRQAAAVDPVVVLRGE